MFTITIASIVAFALTVIPAYAPEIVSATVQGQFRPTWNSREEESFFILVRRFEKEEVAETREENRQWDELLTWVDEQVEVETPAIATREEPSLGWDRMLIRDTSDLGWDNMIIRVTLASWDAPAPRSKTRPSLLGTCQVRRK